MASPTKRTGSGVSAKGRIAKSADPIRVAFFFGAGAEVAYGMPSGGYFALEIFRRIDKLAQAEFRSQRAGIDPLFYPEWLPRGFKNLRVHQFGKPERRRVFEETLQIKRFEIVELINGFDLLALKAMKGLGGSENALRAALRIGSGLTLGAKSYETEIVLETTLGDAKGLFSSRFFSAALDLSNGDGETLILARSILELLVGALGQNLAEDLNSRIFSRRPKGVDFLEEIGSLFRVDSGNAGQTAFDRVMEGPVPALTPGSSEVVMLRSVLLSVTEEIVALTLSYQKLIDEYYASLFNPHDWARFSKISIFLHSVRNYIDAQQQTALSATGTADGVYHDVANAIRNKALTVTGIGTSNYTQFWTLS